MGGAGPAVWDPVFSAEERRPIRAALQQAVWLLSGNSSRSASRLGEGTPDSDGRGPSLAGGADDGLLRLLRCLCGRAVWGCFFEVHRFPLPQTLAKYNFIYFEMTWKEAPVTSVVAELESL